MQKILLRFIPALLWMAVIFFLSHQAAESSDQQSGVFVALLAPIAGGMDIDLLTTIIRKSAHFSAYLILGILLFWALQPLTKSAKRAGGMSVIIAALFALSDEFHQSFIPGRSAELRDVAIDTAGSISGIIIVWFVLYMYKRNKMVQ